MASIHQRQSGIWYVSFRFGGTQFFPSLKTRSKRKAENARSRVEDAVDLLETGRISLPDHATREQTLQFILSGAKTAERPKVNGSVDLKTVVDQYLDNYTVGKEQTTIAGEKIHIAHFQRILGDKLMFSSLDTDKLQTYAAKRSKETGLNGKRLSPETVKKEFRTFNQIWKMAVAKGYAFGPSPTKSVRLELTDEKPPFMTWDEIEAIIERGDLTGEQQKEYWDSLFLDEKQILELLSHVDGQAEHTFIYAAMSFAAFTGARRSEVIRSLMEDWDLRRGIVRIREKKGSRKKKTTFREVNIHPRLKKTMKSWFDRHPGGNYTIVVPAHLARSRVKHERPTPLTPSQAHDHFQRAIADSKWQVLKGWHVLRHSFCSNCARRGIPDSIIDVWMGHRGDEEIKRRYRHLFPTDKKKFMMSLFS